MNQKDIQYFKIKLEKEKEILENELSTVGKKSGDKTGMWKPAVIGEVDVDAADENEVADKMEELEENELIVGQLDKQLNFVNLALEKIDEGKYGACEVCGKIIEKDRLEANPSAKTCKAHMK